MNLTTAEPANGVYRGKELPHGASPRTSLPGATKRWRWIALSTLLVATAWLPFVACDGSWRTVTGCPERTLNDACVVGPLVWTTRVRTDGVALGLARADGPMGCALGDPHTSFAYRLDGEDADVEYRCISRAAAGTATMTAFARYRFELRTGLTTTHAALRLPRARSRHVLAATAALLAVALFVAKWKGRRPNLCDLRRPWREATADGGTSATLDDGTRIPLPREAASLPRGRSILVDLETNDGGGYRSAHRTPGGTFWGWAGTRSSLRAQVERTEARRWRRVTLLAASALSIEGASTLPPQLVTNGGPIAAALVSSRSPGAIEKWGRESDPRGDDSGVCFETCRDQMIKCGLDPAGASARRFSCRWMCDASGGTRYSDPCPHGPGDPG